MELVCGLIYLLLFLFSVLFMFRKKHKESVMIFLVLATGGLSILPYQVGFIKATHLTFLYIVFFFFKYKKSIKNHIRTNKEYVWLVRLFIFFLLSILVSIIYFRFPIKECVTTGLRYLLFLAFLVFIPLKREDYSSIFRFLFYITFITSVIYIVQCIIGTQLLPSSSSFDADDKTAGVGGIYHFLNIPTFTFIFIPISIFCKSLIPDNFRIIAPVVFFSALFVTLFRIHIAAMVICIVVAMLLRKQSKKNVLPLFILVSMILLFGEIFHERTTEQNDSASDVSLVLEGRVQEADYQARDGMTLLYRAAWVAERFNYIKERPIELLFGLGMISEEKTQNKYYRFNFGLINEETGLMNQISTPDIAWGNLLTRYGLIGSIFLMSFFFSIMKKFYGRRNIDDLNLALYSYFVYIFLASFSGATISDPVYWQPLFFMFAYANKRCEIINN